VYTPLLVKLISRGLFFKFARKLINSNLKIKENFTADDMVIKKFKAFLKKNKFQYDAADFKKEIKNIRYEIEKDVLSNKFSAEKGVTVFLDSDPVSRKAVEQLQIKLESKVKSEKELLPQRHKDTKKKFSFYKKKPLCLRALVANKERGAANGKNQRKKTNR
jgi:hypothetical protein